MINDDKMIKWNFISPTTSKRIEKHITNLSMETNMKTNKQRQVSSLNQKWYIGGLTVLLLGAGATWAFNSSPEPPTVHYQQTASAQRRGPAIKTPTPTVRGIRSDKTTITKPDRERRVRVHEPRKSTDRRDKRRNGERKVKKDDDVPAA